MGGNIFKVKLENGISLKGHMTGKVQHRVFRGFY